MWGIKPKAEGYKIVTIKPQMASLTSSSIEVPTLRVQIKASYVLYNGIKTYTIEIPASIEAEFVVAQNLKVKLNHKNISVDNSGVINLTTGKHLVEILD